MNATGLRPGASWTVRLLAAIVCLVSLYLIGTFLVFAWQLFGSNVDFPPTWYLTLTVLVIVADVAAMCYIVFGVIRLVVRRAAPAHTIRAAVVLVLLLGVFHAAAVCAYSRIPQWDFQDGYFDDLSWPGPGRISQDCRQVSNQSGYPEANASASSTSYGERPTSYEEIRRIAWIQDWKVHDSELENRTAVGWRGWIQDVVRHGYNSNPEHRLVTVLLHDPYPSGVAAGFSQWSVAVLSYFDPSDAGKLAVGQEVLVCGRITDAGVYNDSDIQISVSRPVVNPLPFPDVLTTTQVPADFVVEYEAHGCGDGYDCAEYDLRIVAEGNVTYRGFANVPVTGTHTTHIPKDRLKQLVFELQRTNFLAIDYLPDTLQGNLKGATILRAAMNGRRNSVVLPWRGGGSWPIKVRMAIGKIEEVSNLQQWVNLVTSP